MSLLDIFKKKKNAEPSRDAKLPDVTDSNEYLTDSENQFSKSPQESDKISFFDNSVNVTPPDDATGTSEELTYEETVMLKYLDGITYGKIIKNYMYERFGDRLNEIGEEFLLSGYFELTTAEENLQKATVPELKEVLKNHNLKVSDGKAELVKRIIDNIPHDELEHLFPDSRYKLTKLGETAISDKELFFINEKHATIFTNAEIKTALKENPNMAPLSVYEKMLKDKGQFYYKNNKISMLQVIFSTLYCTNYERQDYLGALYNAFASEYIVMSGLYDYNIVSSYFMSREHEVNVSCIDNCLSALNYSTDKFKEMATKQFVPILPSLAFSFYTPETFIDMICDRLNGIYKSSKEYPYNKPETDNPNYSYTKLE